MNRFLTIDQLLFWGFCGVLFFIPFFTSLTVILSILILVVWVCSGRVIRERERWVKEEWFLPVILFVLLPWVGLLYTEDIKNGLGFALKSHYWLLAFALASLSFQKYHVKILLNSFLAGLLLTSSITILQFIKIIPMIKGHLGFINPITFSLLTVFGILLLSFYFRDNNEPKYRIFIFFLIVLLLSGLAINQGRAGYVALFLTSPVIAYNLFGQRSWLKIGIASIVLIIAVILSPVARDRIGMAMNDIKLYYEGNPNTSVGLRLVMWEGAIKIFLEHPFLGVGTGGYKSSMKKYIPLHLSPDIKEFSQPHNSFLYMASNHGIIGVFLLFWIFFIFLKAGWEYRKSLVGFSILSFGMVLLIGSLTDTQIIEVHTGIMFAILMGLQRSLKIDVHNIK